MTFVSDNAMLRTFDAKSGWELFNVGNGREYENFEIRHANVPSIRFWGEVLNRKPNGRRREDGELEIEWEFRVHAVGNNDPAKASKLKRKLIGDALYAYGTVHNGPIGPLRVVFVSNKEVIEEKRP